MGNRQSARYAVTQKTSPHSQLLLLYLLLCCVEQVLQGLRVDGAGVQLHEYAHHATQLHVLGSMHITDFLCSSLLLQLAAVHIKA